jgi:glycosyltransferase involved in cell wall biosynthesis
MSYQREPTIAQIKKAVKWSKKSTLSFTGCSNYISQQISPYAQSFTVYNGIDLKIYDFKTETSSNAPLVFLGRIEPIKGTHVAIKAALETGKDLIIAGNIPPEYQHYFETEIKPFLSSQINYVGPVNDVQKNEILGSAAAFLMPIEWNEPFGIVMAEALACGTPVIGYRKGSVPEVVQHGINGYIAEDFNSLCNYIDKSSELSRIKTRETAVNNFSSLKIIEDYTQIYQKLTHQPLV